MPRLIQSYYMKSHTSDASTSHPTAIAVAGAPWRASYETAGGGPHGAGPSSNQHFQQAWVDRSYPARVAILHNNQSV
jgi:hypothetical protein